MTRMCSGDHSRARERVRESTAALAAEAWDCQWVAYRCRVALMLMMEALGEERSYECWTKRTHVR